MDSQKVKAQLIELHGMSSAQELETYIDNTLSIIGGALAEETGSDFHYGTFKNAVKSLLNGSSVEGPARGFAEKTINLLLLDKIDGECDRFRAVINDGLRKSRKTSATIIDIMSVDTPERQEEIINSSKIEKSDDSSGSDKLTHKEKVMLVLLTIADEKEIWESRDRFEAFKADEAEVPTYLLSDLKGVQETLEDESGLDSTQVSNALSQLKASQRIFRKGPYRNMGIYIPIKELHEAGLIDESLSQTSNPEELLGDPSEMVKSENLPALEKSAQTIRHKLELMDQGVSDYDDQIQELESRLSDLKEKREHLIELKRKENREELEKQLRILNFAIEELK